ncbi:hypothetical protein PVAND_005664 [Polypedilum vanderplanki]|uniref:Uncharacterized protein n=1 Tax=Polypedilum vanderplanki TaxID=319348 RepID=A0A9J6C2R0_POLVA|nr:hypothetical protein PVAND_005664 [Polypedilum vanderplanki]
MSRLKLNLIKIIFILIFSLFYSSVLTQEIKLPSIIKNVEKNNSLYIKLQHIDNSFKETIDCDSKDIKITQNTRIINLSSCGSYEMSQLNLFKLINDSLYAFIILIEINEADYDFGTYQQLFSNLLEVDASKSLLIVFYNKYNENEEIQVIGESQELVNDLIVSSDNCLKLIKDAMNENCSVCLRLMQLINNFSDFELTAYDIENLKCNSECFRAFLNLPYNFNFNGIYIDVYEALHSSHIKYMKASREDAQEINGNFTSDDFLYDKVNITKCDILTSIAWKLKRFNIFEFLIRADCAYPQNFIDERSNSFDYPSDKKFVKKVENHIAKIEKFHKDVKTGNLKGVQTFVNAHSELLFARTTDNKSALKAAFDSDNLKIFSYLRSTGMYFGSFTEIADYYTTKSQFKNSKKKLIRQYNRMFIKPARIDIIEKLIDRSLVHYDAKVYTNVRIISELRRIFTDLNEFISEALVIAAASNQLEIIFDFDNSDLDEFDPIMDGAYGAAYSFHDYLIISGLDLIGSDEEKRNFALGTLAHELFHHVTHQIYGNSFSPYEQNDIKRKKKFEKIFEATRLIKNEDSLIKTVFRSDSIEEHNHGELIARIPDILLTNRHNLTYINECKRKFKELFNYYENEVLKDLREFIPIINTREKVNEYNEWFNVLGEIQDDDEDEKNSSEKGSNEDDDSDDHESFLNSIKNRTNVVFSYYPKRKIKKISQEANKLKFLAIFVKSSFGNHKNFKKVMFKIDTLDPSILLIIDCDDLKGMENFDQILDRTSFEKIVVVVDNKHYRKFKNLNKSVFYEDWVIL